MNKQALIKIAAVAGLGTGIVCLVDGLLWDLIPFNGYRGMFWLSFLPLILFFMKEDQDRKYLVNMWLSFVCGLLWGLIALVAVKTLSPVGAVPADIVIDFLICGLIVFVHKGLLCNTLFNAVACVFLGFAETLGCICTGFIFNGELAMPGTLNGIDMLIVFTLGLIVTFFLSLLCDVLINKIVFKGKPSESFETGQSGAKIQG